jgi:hypothetical protein
MDRLTPEQAGKLTELKSQHMAGAASSLLEGKPGQGNPADPGHLSPPRIEINPAGM